VTDLEDLDGSPLIVDRIDDPVVPLPDPVSFLGRKLLAALRPRLVAERPDPFDDSANVLFRNPAQLSGR